MRCIHLLFVLLGAPLCAQDRVMSAPAPPPPEAPVSEADALTDLLMPEGNCSWRVAKASATWTWLKCTATVDSLTFSSQRRFLSRRKHVVLRLPCATADSLRAMPFEVSTVGNEAILAFPTEQVKFRVSTINRLAPVCKGHEPCVRLSSIPASMADPTMDIYLFRDTPPAP